MPDTKYLLQLIRIGNRRDKVATTQSGIRLHDISPAFPPKALTQLGLAGLLAYSILSAFPC